MPPGPLRPPSLPLSECLLQGTWSRARSASARGASSRAYEKRAAASTASSPRWSCSTTPSCARRPTRCESAPASGEPLDDLLPEAFALAREAARRSIGQRHYDVQLIGGMVLHDGSIAEMKTGEGKTLTATLAVFLNTLAGDSVHLVTVNDYLARRDAEWMKPVYDALGVSAVLVRRAGQPSGTAVYFVLLEWSEGTVISIRDFRYARYAMEGAEVLALE